LYIITIIISVIYYLNRYVCNIDVKTHTNTHTHMYVIIYMYIYVYVFIYAFHNNTLIPGCTL